VAAAADGRVEALAAGRDRVEVRDRFTGQTTEFAVEVIRPQLAEVWRGGEGDLDGASVAAGDVDGDGWPDALMGIPEASVDAWYGGAVYLYRGGPNGLLPQPARIFTGRTWQEEYGSGVAAADFDDDGLVDLAIGAPRGDAAGTQSGFVEIYRGVPAGLFEAEPSQILRGRFSWEGVGESLTACDVNGDGFLDLMAGAPWSEDRNLASIEWNQGAVYLYLGGPAGFGLNADQIVFGQVPDGSGGWQAQRNLSFGLEVASGDVNGDGLCDLVVGSYTYDPPGGGSYADAGAVWLHLGEADDGLRRGGVSEIAAAAWTATTTGTPGNDDVRSLLARNLAVGDLDADGYADLIAGQYCHTHDYWDWNGRRCSGAARVHRGGPGFTSGGPSQWLDIAQADWSYEGDTHWDYVGFQVGAGDADGDGVDDLLLGNVRDERAGGPSDGGEVALFLGRAGSMPGISPDRVWSGPISDGYFGTTFALVGDFDGDGWQDLQVRAAIDDTNGYDLGRPWYIASADGRYTELDQPGVASGQRIGQGTAVLGDVNGDGFEDALVSASYFEGPTGPRNAGEAWLYLGTAQGFDEDAALTLRGFSDHGSWDNLGESAANVGDFDGDGVDDFALSAFREEAPNGAFDGAYANPDDCYRRDSDAGAIFVWRGNAAGLPEAEPAFVYYGERSGDYIQHIAGGADVNGDGYGDIVYGSLWWDRPGSNDVGGAGVLLGRPWMGGGIQVLCAPEAEFLGNEGSGHLGSSVAAVGDVDGDGCDEVAVGARREDLGLGDQGSARVIFGWGPGCNRAEPEHLTFVSANRNARAGTALAGGHDLDGDGLPDLAVGGDDLVDANGRLVGGVWLVSSMDLAMLAPEPWVDGADPAQTHLLGSASGTYFAGGRSNGGRFGQALTLVPNFEADGRAALAVGAPSSSWPGAPEAGAVFVHRFDLDPGAYGLRPWPEAVIAGEVTSTPSEMGYSLDAGSLGAGPVLLIGAARSDALSLDSGAGYVAGLERP
jgi:hypothetical protein